MLKNIRTFDLFNLRYHNLTFLSLIFVLFFDLDIFGFWLFFGNYSYKKRYIFVYMSTNGFRSGNIKI